MEETTKKKESLLDEAKKPFNRLMLFIAIGSIIISIGIGYLFYRLSLKEKDISYQINKPISLIFDSKNTSSKIKLFEKDSIPINDNVYLLTGTIWNSGDLPIMKEDVRKQLSFVLDSAKRILDFKIVKQKDESVAKFNLVIVNSNTLNIDWSFFDPKYGFTFQIMYTGSENPDFKISGVVLDVQVFNEILPTSKGINNFVMINIVVYLSITMLSLIYIVQNKKNKPRLDRFFFNLLIGCGLVFIVLSIIYYLNVYNPIPF